MSKHKENNAPNKYLIIHIDEYFCVMNTGQCSYIIYTVNIWYKSECIGATLMAGGVVGIIYDLRAVHNKYYKYTKKLKCVISV